ncbi:hypothetical protein SAMN00017405_1815 [Desulfonispora thiosulfatigenes DSM 11270]|uniref:Uncharacterized protein n=1 Tax=Desulfonispora thiosulfatigenes DSM 11270 TaxID=656914 RepID=A0A1W1V3S5_DESTI|nr:hypothetical protein [Desulfonispora thiosulfatigenes]SMB88019.1 hypothetical protein SAMN00017405_1815 [Desulfonispora thiosulfatigenes DSM 11270]
MFYLLILIVVLVAWVDLVPLFKDNKKDNHKKIIYVTASFLVLSLISSGLVYYETVNISAIGAFMNDIFKSIFPAFYKLMEI